MQSCRTDFTAIAPLDFEAAERRGPCHPSLGDSIDPATSYVKSQYVINPNPPPMSQMKRKRSGSSIGGCASGAAAAVPGRPGAASLSSATSLIDLCGGSVEGSVEPPILDLTGADDVAPSTDGFRTTFFIPGRPAAQHRAGLRKGGKAG